jgi:hypothetical protein
MKILEIIGYYTLLSIVGLNIFILFFLLSFFGFCLIKIIFDKIEINQKIKKTIKQKDYGLHFDFYDKQTRHMYYKLLYNDKNDEFHKFISQINKDNAFYKTNRIPKNYHITLVAFQATEYYVNCDKKYLERIFLRFVKIAAKNDKFKYYQLKNKIDEIIDKLINNRYSFFSDIMIGFEFVFNNKIIDRITIFFDAIGAGLIKIGYNVYLTNDYMYKYWLLVTNDFNNLLKINKNPIINRGKITFDYGYNVKATEISNFQRAVQKSIYQKIRKIAPGVFIKTYKTIPTVIVLEKNEIKYLIKIKNFLFTEREEIQNNAFYTILRNDSVNNINDFYYNISNQDIYVPLKINNYIRPTLNSKYFRTIGSPAPINLLFNLDITANLYRIYYYFIEKAKNIYFENTIKGKLFLGLKINKEIDKIEALVRLIEEAYNIEKNKYLKPFNKEMKYYANMETKYESEYFDDYINVIKKYKKSIKNEMQKVKNIYNKHQNRLSKIIGIALAIITIILTIVTILQTYWGYKTKNEGKNEINKDYIEKMNDL